ncbi:hypothetical protein SAMD00019534_114650 [Acytostelium subglobosum LB1]|uniref:hypothetical protein n=1 Tax=Acytostelium subglobosum LB1 TaxID=1410327 RepID=UPI000644DA79|nr:hypothetical protein SAMD00019534_114650 [Acytostelium subglobosum LB1]GAM28289.1 hypothetical protein SAMD00019534_114650 [Acytostelium subglobosum LB1]|eukprot:XP_012748923.1 hypothetical protein SAMD00019534_114650 [Acytostelium subglobosum LB1]
MVETLKLFDVYRKKCHEKANELTACHSQLSDVVDTKSSCISFAKENCSKIRIVLSGPTHSGKSTLTNTLLGCQLMPSGAGHTSGRICIMAYSKKIRIKFYTIILPYDKEPGMLKRIDNETITLESKEFNAETKKKLLLLMKESLGRTAEIDNDPEKFERWARKIVKVKFPSPLLETGIEIVDVPGFSVSDSSSLLPIRTDFFKVYNPNGVIFCYNNTAVSDGEVLALPDLMKSLPKDWTAKESVFFANTKTSKSEVAVNNGMDPLDEVPLEYIHTHMADSLNKLKGSSFNDATNRMCIHERRFAMVNAMEFAKSPKSVENRFIFQHFINRLVRWMGGLIQRQCDMVLTLLELECLFMTIKIESVQSYISNIVDFNTLLKESDQLSIDFAAVVIVTMIKVIETIPALVKRAFDHNQERIKDFQQTVNKLAQNDISFRLLAVEFLFEQVIKKVIKLIEEVTATAISGLTKKYFEKGDFVNLIMRGTMEDMESALKSSFPTLLSTALSGAISSSIFEGFLLYFTVPTGKAKAESKMDLKTLVEKYPESISTKTLEKDIVQAVITQFKMFKTFQMLQHDRLRLLIKSSNLLPAHITTCLNSYHTLYLEVLALNCNVHFPFKGLHVDRSKVVAIGDIGSLYSGSLKTNSFLVQVVEPKKSDTIHRKLLWQAKLSNHVPKEVPMVPLQAVFQQRVQRDDGADDDVEWLLAFKEYSPMVPYLKEHISMLTPLQSLTMITQLVKALAYIHDEGITHENVKLEFIYINPETKDVYLSMFGDVSGIDQVRTTNYPKASLDLEALGVVICELLPKPTLKRFTVDQVSANPNSTIDKLVPMKHHVALATFVQHCFNKQATIKDITSKLEELIKHL